MSKFIRGFSLLARAPVAKYHAFNPQLRSMDGYPYQSPQTSPYPYPYPNTYPSTYPNTYPNINPVDPTKPTTPLSVPSPQLSKQMKEFTRKLKEGKEMDKIRRIVSTSTRKKTPAPVKKKKGGGASYLWSKVPNLRNK
jgi:hypothetical protein